MGFNVKEHEGDFLMVPLGGTGEIGMNVTLYHSNGKWIIIDLGVGFSDADLPGTDLTVADVSFIVNQKKNLLGIVLTHAHEDHFGAIQYLWEELRCPIYAAPFTAAFLRAKLAVSKIEGAIPIYEYSDDNAVLNLDDFRLTFLRVTHSIPDAFSVLIETQGLRVFHTGDFKLDSNPVISAPTNLQELEAIGDQGVDMLVCDSTNVFNEYSSGNEGDLIDSFRMIFPKTKGMVYASMFASNIARVHTVAAAARECGRKVFLLGGALNRAVEAARSVGYLEDIDNIHSIDEIESCPRNEALIICTGCQGEPLASMSKIVEGRFHGIEIKAGDAVVFSSVIIPGNELRVCRIMNSVVAAGAKLYAGRSANIHVSGHPGQPELKKMYALLRPKVAVPVHGEIMHLHKHAEMALEWGAKTVLNIVNGAVVKLDSEGAEVIGKVKSGKYAIDGRFFRAPNSEVMQVRRNMMAGGIVIATVLLCAETGRLLKKPTIIAPGLLDSQHDKDIVRGLVSQIEKELFSKSNMPARVVRSVVFSIIKRTCQKRMNKYPEIRVQVERV